jgi:raffinose/stachyose/melibiose transport system permease protein
MITTRKRTPSNRSLMKVGSRLVLYALLSIWAVIQLYPIFWMFMTGFKTEKEFTLDPLSFPGQVYLDNWVFAWQGGIAGAIGDKSQYTIPVFFRNSSIVTIPSLAALVLITSLAAYAIARYRFIGRRIAFGFFIAMLAVPMNSVIISVFILYAKLKLLNNFLGIIFIHIAFNISFAVILLVAYFKTFPQELIDAATIDGCGDFRVFSRIVMPISKGTISAVAIVDFIIIWNELLFASVLNPKLPTLTVGALRWEGQHRTLWTPMIASLALAAIPTIVFYLVFHRNIIKGITTGAIKS